MAETSIKDKFWDDLQIGFRNPKVEGIRLSKCGMTLYLVRWDSFCPLLKRQPGHPHDASGRFAQDYAAQRLLYGSNRLALNLVWAPVWIRESDL